MSTHFQDAMRKTALLSMFFSIQSVSIQFEPLRVHALFGGSDIHVRSSFLLNYQRFPNFRLLLQLFRISIKNDQMISFF